MYSVLYVSKLKLCLNRELELKLNFDSKWAKLDQYCDNIGKIEQVNFAITFQVAIILCVISLVYVFFFVKESKGFIEQKLMVQGEAVRDDRPTGYQLKIN